MQTSPNPPPDALRRLVERKVSVSVLHVGSPRSILARFDAMDDTTLTLALYAAPHPRPPVNTTACVFYRDDGQVRAFLGEVRGVTSDHHLSLEMPWCVASLETRWAFRIPLDPSELPVQLRTSSGDCPCVARDLSQRGIGLRLVGARAGPEPGDFVRIKLGEANRACVVSGSVVHTSGANLGVAFEAPLPERLIDIVHDAEMRWRARLRD